MDRSDSFGSFGPLYMEIASAIMASGSKPVLINKIFGLGGRDFLPEHAEMVLSELDDISKGASVSTFKEYIAVRE